MRRGKRLERANVALSLSSLAVVCGVCMRRCEDDASDGRRETEVYHVAVGCTRLSSVNEAFALWSTVAAAVVE